MIIARQLEQAIEEQWPDELKNSLPDISGYGIFRVRNVGNLEAKNVVVDLPFSGFAEILAQDGGMTIEKFSNSILLGNIRAKNETIVNVWTNRSPSRLSRREIQFTHDDGVTDIAFVADGDAIFDRISPWWFNPRFTWAIAGGIIIISWIYLAYRAGITSGRSSNGSQEKKIPEKEKPDSEI